MIVTRWERMPPAKQSKVLLRRRRSLRLSIRRCAIVTPFSRWCVNKASYRYISQMTFGVLLLSYGFLFAVNPASTSRWLWGLQSVGCKSITEC